ncbi:hypothetical protein E2542_SST23245 [Spatholobus suberectus]|nr:hypothetical protein E2542_SST23245 [Spatholobus suberectus]
MFCSRTRILNKNTEEHEDQEGFVIPKGSASVLEDEEKMCRISSAKLSIKRLTKKIEKTALECSPESLQNILTGGKSRRLTNASQNLVCNVDFYTIKMLPSPKCSLQQLLSSSRQLYRNVCFSIVKGNYGPITMCTSILLS